MSQATHTIQRAFQLAAQSASIADVRSQLKREGYPQVDAHLEGRKIREDLKKLLGGKI